MTNLLNHARTLLMNISGDNDAAGYTCHELIDPDFRAVRLPAGLLRVRAALFGIHPDKDMLAVRCRQLLGLAEATPLLEYLRSFDSRVTYDFSKPVLELPAEPVTVAVRSYGTHGTLQTLGQPDPPDATGQMRYSFSVEVNEDATAIVTRINPPVQTTESVFAVGEAIQLPGTGMTFKLDSTATGQAFTVDILARPTRDLAALADACASLGEPTQIALFGISTEEPYKTFRELWLRKKELPLRLGALVCALVYRSEEARGKV